MDSSQQVNLEEIISRTREDVKQLESQIRHLLKSMETIGNIESVPNLSLPECRRSDKIGKPEMLLEWRGLETKKHRKGKAFPEPVKQNITAALPLNNCNDSLTSLEILELCISDQTSKYQPLDDSIFFVPVLDRCIFGMTILNVANKKLRKPKLALSALQSSEQKRIKAPLSFEYDAKVIPKEINPEKVDKAKAVAGIVFQDAIKSSLAQYYLEEVVPGCEVLVTASFATPEILLQADDGFTLLISLSLDGEELWARRIPVTCNDFHAAYIDGILKKHQVSILSALGVHQESFKFERLLLQDDKTPFKSLERFLSPLGFEHIDSRRTGADTSIEIFTVNQPSMLWGVSFKIEKCLKKPTVVRCLVTSRSQQQMHYLFKQFKAWLSNEIYEDNKYGMGGPVVGSIYPNNSLLILEKLENEIQLILKLQQVKAVFGREGTQGTTPSQKTNYYNGDDNDSIDASWIKEYISCVTETDASFFRHMKE